MNRRAKIAGTGMFVPGRVVTNQDLTQWMDTSDEWIQQRSGIQRRHYVEPGQKPSELAERASRRALEAAGLDAGDLDCIVLATLSAEADFPGTSFFLQDRLGVGETLVPAAPVAIGCAIANAIGVRPRELPLTPERILRALHEHEGRA